MVPKETARETNLLNNVDVLVTDLTKQMIVCRATSPLDRSVLWNMKDYWSRDQ